MLSSETLALNLCRAAVRAEYEAVISSSREQKETDVHSYALSIEDLSVNLAPNEEAIFLADARLLWQTMMLAEPHLTFRQDFHRFYQRVISSP